MPRERPEVNVNWIVVLVLVVGGLILHAMRLDRQKQQRQLSVDAGYAAATAGLSIDDNPYQKWSEGWSLWRHGHNAGSRDRVTTAK